MRHRAQKPPSALGRYASGQKRCQVCEIFLNWEGIWCPCCGYRVRTRPRGQKFKALLRTMDQNVRIRTPANRSIQTQERIYSSNKMIQIK